MVSAAGSGELLFTPRVAAQYGYALLWALLVAVALKWFINREIGRYTVCTGATVLEGFSRLPGPKNWALYLILIPQLVVAAVSIAGLASGAASALTLVLPGDLRLWTVLSIVASAALVLLGKYKNVERVARVFAIVLALAAIAAAVAVRPSVPQIASGIVPSIPAEVDFGEILPWLGYMLSGAAGLMWYSYWVKAKGYGVKSSDGVPVDPTELTKPDQDKLAGWLKLMSLDTTVAVVGALLITLAFLVLGAELLQPRGLVPGEEKMAETLGHLLGGVWGAAGFWFMILGVFVGFWDTVLSDQDGFGRLFSNGTSLLARALGAKGAWLDESKLRTIFVIGLVTVVPIALFLIIGKPVTLLKISGAIEAAHIPVVAGLVLFLNMRDLPAKLRTSWFSLSMTVVAAVFFAAFAAFYGYRLIAGQ